MSDETANSNENSESRGSHLAPYQFKPGQSGNPNGRPKKKPLTELYEQMLSDPELLATIQVAVKKAVSKGQMAMVLQLKEMAERVEGKITQPIDGDLTVTNLTLSERMQRARERSDESGS